jgi:hypothetical protein
MGRLRKTRLGLGVNAMSTEPPLRTLRGLAWLVAARNEIQSLMVRLYERWTDVEEEKRQLALGGAFSLWRAVFLIDTTQEANRSLPALDLAAHRFLEKVIETNAIGFADDFSSSFSGSTCASWGRSPWRISRRWWPSR